MAKSVITSVGLKSLLNSGTGRDPTLLAAGLYKDNDGANGPSTAITARTRPSYAGYADKPIAGSAWTDAVVDASPTAKTSGPALTFQHTDVTTAETVYGFFLVDEDGVVVSVHEFDQKQTVSGSGSITVVPELDFTPKSVA